MPSLRLATLPFRPSFLSIPPSPSSPRSPLSPSKSRKTTARALPSPRWSPTFLKTLSPASRESLSHPEISPLRWVWQCHMCRSKYNLGVTRRCLEDGHHFCSGQSTIVRKGNRRIRKEHSPCASEFDYSGWKAWGEWRRGVQEVKKALMEIDMMEGVGQRKEDSRSCWGHCDYPSECRWSKRLQGQEPGSV